ncbi:membrane bound O-acyl transferase family-domain-containing protein [Rhodofomes roseus]|uniref:Membrane bound O-acyl transferase family-domain-containing protein n=1 Tax=Rhodofomes roseus TaxID=34475 RepID=A0ABQ8KQ49_9APHY|nr:membrane bound O-acyl transferase family-domain-containing protein [Rhodofomes roseus]KAH9840645.1 membrane bound O-acyl transferase family-domain-containing protein [Rhodofomes roseus]
MEAGSRPRLPLLPFFAVLQTCLACLLALQPRKPSRVAGSIGLVAFIAAAYCCTTGEAPRDYSIGNLIMIQAFTAVLLLWLVDPVHDYCHESDGNALAKLPFVRRMWRLLCIINNPRGVGWSYEVAHLPPRPSSPKWTFVVHKLACALRWYLFLDLAQTYNRSSLRLLHDSAVGPQAWLIRPISIIARFSSLVGLLALENSLAAATSVALGMSLPREWPDIYGRWSDAYTVRRFWGRTYHQLLRRLTASCGKACCHALGLRPGTRASSYTQLYIGFAVSGFLHCGGDLMVSPYLFGTSFPFFMSQAVAITLEDAVIGAVRTSGMKVPIRVAHLAGYLWAITWLCISAPLYVNWSLLISLTVPSVTTAFAGTVAIALKSLGLVN